ncbi:MAG TPA: hypothetical protein H9684_06455 [Firmicutes bacterium]|nr:hypothetical protein [Bacillota bacterium]
MREAARCCGAFPCFLLPQGSPSSPVALRSHAGEVIRDGDSYYITCAGWRGFDIPCEGGVAIAELTFEPEEGR